MAEQSTLLKGRVAGKVALVTGAASGIGQATAQTFADQGAAVCCADVNRAGVEATAAVITAAGGSAWPCHLDVTSEPAWSHTMEELVQRQGRLDIAVNCAGIAFACPVTEMLLED
jgi:NAD(P)-dependent dehydrogenase (short-subunit alcohol dehydrogenase family)